MAIQSSPFATAEFALNTKPFAPTGNLVVSPEAFLIMISPLVVSGEIEFNAAVESTAVNNPEPVAVAPKFVLAVPAVVAPVPPFNIPSVPVTIVKSCDTKPAVTRPFVSTVTREYVPAVPIAVKVGFGYVPVKSPLAAPAGVRASLNLASLPTAAVVAVAP